MLSWLPACQQGISEGTMPLCLTGFGCPKAVARLRNPGLKLLPGSVVNTTTVLSLASKGWRTSSLLPLTLWKRRKRPVAELHLEVRAQPAAESFYVVELVYYPYIKDTAEWPCLQAIVEVLLRCVEAFQPHRICVGRAVADYDFERSAFRRRHTAFGS